MVQWFIGLIVDWSNVLPHVFRNNPYVSKHLQCKKGVIMKSRELKLQLILLNFYEKQGAQAPADFIEFLWDQKTHLQGTRASTSLKSSAYLFYLHCGEKNLFRS